MATALQTLPSPSIRDTTWFSVRIAAHKSEERGSKPGADGGQPFGAGCIGNGTIGCCLPRRTVSMRSPARRSSTGSSLMRIDWNPSPGRLWPVQSDREQICRRAEPPQPFKPYPPAFHRRCGGGIAVRHGSGHSTCQHDVGDDSEEKDHHRRRQETMKGFACKGHPQCLHRASRRFPKDRDDLGASVITLVLSPS